ncbi:hypothetical protein HanIR_Chr01g0044151 [Helianthus annuus]|nr:hypothetical protein HanIR_Chr01g0044151 [Helianthus annuus]
MVLLRSAAGSYGKGGMTSGFLALGSILVKSFKMLWCLVIFGIGVDLKIENCLGLTGALFKCFKDLCGCCVLLLPLCWGGVVYKSLLSKKRMLLDLELVLEDGT